MSSTNAERLREYFAPGRYNSLRPTAGADLRFDERVEVMHQGSSWHRAGLATTPEMHDAIREAERAIYPDGVETTDIRTWQTSDPDTAFLEYRTAGRMWNDRQMVNGGLAVFEFADGAVRRVRNFTNTAYLQAVEAGWSDLVPYKTLLRIPAFRTIDLPVESERPLFPSPDAKFDDEPAYDFAQPWTNEQRVQLKYDPSTFEYLGPPRPGEPFYTQTDDMYYEWQGTKWMMAGRNYQRDIDAAVAAGRRFEFKMHPWLRFASLKTWSTPDQEWVFMEWMSVSEMWTGAPFRNHGMTAMWFPEEGRIAAHREYCNAAYNETLEGDWRDQVTPEVFATRATSATWDLPSEDWVPNPIHP